MKLVILMRSIGFLIIFRQGEVHSSEKMELASDFDEDEDEDDDNNDEDEDEERVEVVKTITT